MERIVTEGTPLTLEERLERQANEIRTKEQQIEQLKAENDHWQEVCADLHIEYGEQTEAQQQEIRLLSMEIAELREQNQALKDYAENADADKDEQAGQIMRMEEGIKKAKQMFKNIEIITSCPETGNERNAMQMAIDGHRLMVALLGGKEDV